MMIKDNKTINMNLQPSIHNFYVLFRETDFKGLRVIKLDLIVAKHKYMLLSLNDNKFISKREKYVLSYMKNIIVPFFKFMDKLLDNDDKNKLVFKRVTKVWNYDLKKNIDSITGLLFSDVNKELTDIEEQNKQLTEQLENELSNNNDKIKKNTPLIVDFEELVSIMTDYYSYNELDILNELLLERQKDKICKQVEIIKRFIHSLWNWITIQHDKKVIKDDVKESTRFRFVDNLDDEIIEENEIKVYTLNDVDNYLILDSSMLIYNIYPQLINKASQINVIFSKKIDNNTWKLIFKHDILVDNIHQWFTKLNNMMQENYHKDLNIIRLYLKSLTRYIFHI